MMIRINLLPVRQEEKHIRGRQFVVVVVGTLIIASIANGYWYFWMEGKREQAQRQLDDTNQRIAQLEKVIGEVTNIKKREKEVKEKLKTLADLTKQRSGPVKFLDALATAIPKKVWVTAFAEKGGEAVMSGGAESLDEVSEFMRGLKNLAWGPKGMGRVVETKRDGSGVRMELLGGDASIIDVPMGEVRFFFSNIELKGTETSGVTKGGIKAVKFEMALKVELGI